MRVLAMAAATLLALSTLVSPAHAAAAPIYRYEIINRANSWLTANNGTRVPYSQSLKWTDGYRQDCSGYASMAAKLDKVPDAPNTVALNTSTWTFSISMSELKRGDLVIDALGDGDNRHVVIFDRWTDSAKTRYFAYEQRGDWGTDYRSRTYGLEPYSDYKPRRLHNVIDK
ncbi:hypothetical protein GCM10011609_31060 [Lentzea pudingi]|uniref:Uncharacterized protein n=1 Tax=Lentzea pudingi TaxID=1789439 RepID=A0ABQ2HU04_9PSEU|nr:hypothetical protein [Lentzea pudingi]GGM91573.1 hypothetical protein GCM10011609_31060 [Lentzea pudingi]